MGAYKPSKGREKQRLIRTWDRAIGRILSQRLPSHDAAPERPWRWCDICESYVKRVVYFPAVRDADSGVVVSPRFHGCLCCLRQRVATMPVTHPAQLAPFLDAAEYRGQGRPTLAYLALSVASDPPDVASCITRQLCPATCTRLDVINALRRLGGLTEVTEASHAHSFDLTTARSRYLRGQRAIRERDNESATTALLAQPHRESETEAGHEG